MKVQDFVSMVLAAKRNLKKYPDVWDRVKLFLITFPSS